MNPQILGLLGDSGQANEVELFLKELGGSVAFRAINEEYINKDNPAQVSIENPTPDQQQLPVIVAVGAPAVKQKLVREWPGQNYASLIAKEVRLNEGVTVGSGSVIAPGVVVTTDVEIGEHVLVNVSATLSHNTKLGDYVTVSPGAHIAGNVEIGDGAFIGIGAVISNGVKIAPGVVVGAGAVVIEDITEENAVYVGVPAKKIKTNTDWLNEI